MSFGSDLHKILNICHVKMTSLANHLGYDVSYISKWISGSKSPSERNIEQICEGIAKYCCANASEKELRLLQGHIGIPLGISPGSTMQPLVDYLLRSYMNDKGDSYSSKIQASNPSGLFFSASNRNYSSSLESFLRNVLNSVSEEVLEVIISAHSFLSSASFLDSLLKEFPGRGLKIHVFYDPAEFSSAYDYCRFIFKACSQFQSVETDVSEVKIPRFELSDLMCIVRSNAMLVKGQGVFGGSFPAYVSDVYDVNFQYDKIMSALRGKEFDSYCYGDSQYERYLFKFYEPKDGALVSTLTDEMVVPSFDWVSDNEIQNNLINHDNNPKRLKWYAMLSQAGGKRINNFYYESAIIDFCRSGKARTGPDNCEPIIFSPDSRRTLLEKLIQTIENGETPIYILSDTNSVMNSRDFNGSVAYNGGLACVIPSCSEKVTYIKTPFAIESFNAMFKGLLALSDDYLLQGNKAAEFLHYAMKFIPS